MHEPPPSPWMTSADAATYARVSVMSISLAIRAGRLTVCRFGGGPFVRLHRDDVDAWIRGGGGDANAREQERV